jgi:gliding motility-associated lipoprotein GldH
MSKRTSSLPVILLLAAASVSCGRNIVYTDSKPMPARTWELTNTPVFSVPVKDTLNGNDISFLIRTSASYPFRNIYLFVTTTSPAGKSITDTLQYFLADEKGKRAGRGFGDIRETVLPFKSNVFFPASGTYSFKIQHGMRSESLRGIYDFGIRVTKTGKESLKSGKK